MFFDIRTIVGALLGLYGIVLIITGFVNNTAAQEAKTGGININLWSGIGMAVFALLFILWAYLRPVVTPDSAATSEEEPSTEIP
ncbi:hypothetical protein [Nocardia callitridis]|uniref:DUF485 domain-containing protein n=1 Tax=Nocardia callitridis TaxID=648753 RepID=A0ABP9L5F8_9NOCA